MKLALISDIHSNLIALNLAISDCKKENIDKVIFLGDYITDLENENEVLNIIKKNADYAILGNREKYILNYSPLKKDYNNYKPIYTTFNNLNQENLDYIKSLKSHDIITINNLKILIIHSDIYHNENINNMFDQIINDFDFDICFFGHTHEYLYKEYKNKIFLNPGSIGIPVDSPTYKYCIVDVRDKINVVLKEFRVNDTFNELADKYKSSKYYNSNYSWANLILYSIKNSNSYCEKFIKLFNSKIKNLNQISADEFNEIWDKTYKEFCQKYNLN